LLSHGFWVALKCNVTLPTTTPKRITFCLCDTYNNRIEIVAKIGFMSYETLAQKRAILFRTDSNKSIYNL
jgi:hypothetical protein